jgi:hypothetical protein
MDALHEHQHVLSLAEVTRRGIPVGESPSHRMPA